MLALYRVCIVNSIYTHARARSPRVLYLCVQITKCKLRQKIFTFFVTSGTFLSRSYVVGGAETGVVSRDGFSHKYSVKKGRLIACGLF
jgi:hypothetical protein